MHTIRNCVLISLLGLSLSLLAACQTSSNTTPRGPATGAPGTIGQSADFDPISSPSEPEYPPSKVAILLPLSGQHKGLGQAMLNAAQIALFDIGHSNFKLMPRDTGGTEQGAAAAAQSAINEGAELILGPVFAPSVRAVKPIASRSNINMIAFSTDWTLAGGNAFIMGFLPFDQLKRVTEYAASRNIRNVGLLTPQSNYGGVIARSFNQMAAQSGINITANSTFIPHSSNLAPTIRDFSSQATFEAVLMPAGGEDARAIGNLLSHNNLPPRRVQRIGTGLFDDPALATEANLEGAWFAAPAPKNRHSFESKYYRTYGQKPPRLSTLAYDATALAATLSRRASQSRRDTFNRGAIQNPNGFAGIDGIFRFRSDGTAERGLAVLTFQRGNISVIDEAPRTFQKARSNF